jgi:hypothetical protein
MKLIMQFVTFSSYSSSSVPNTPFALRSQTAPVFVRSKHFWLLCVSVKITIVLYVVTLLGFLIQLLTFRKPDLFSSPDTHIESKFSTQLYSWNMSRKFSCLQ